PLHLLPLLMPRPLKLALLLAPLAVALAIAADTPLGILPQVKLKGVVVEAPAPAGSFWAGRFQPAFERWFEQKLSLRGQMVRLDASVVLALFHEVAARAAIPIILGGDDTLFELNYIHAANDVYTDPPPPSPLSVDDSAQLLGRAARALARRDIAFVVVLYPARGLGGAGARAGALEAARRARGPRRRPRAAAGGAARESGPVRRRRRGGDRAAPARPGAAALQPRRHALDRAGRLRRRAGGRPRGRRRAPALPPRPATPRPW